MAGIFPTWTELYTIMMRIVILELFVSFGVLTLSMPMW